MKKEIKFSNEDLDNIGKNAKLSLSEDWCVTVLELCEQSKMINDVESISDIFIESISELPSDKYVVGHNRK